MKYCSFCGMQMEDDESFCSRCGRDASGSRAQGHVTAGEDVKPEPKGRMCCELAYSGVLFWLPLIACREEKHARFHANQGLWVLITATAACLLIQLLDAMKTALSGLSGVILVGSTINFIHGFLYVVFILFMLYLAYQCIKKALAIHEGKEPELIMFFDRIRFFK